MVAFDGLLKIFTLWNTGQERRGSVGSTQVMKQCYEDTREATPTLGATEVSCALLGGACPLPISAPEATPSTCVHHACIFLQI